MLINADNIFLTEAFQQVKSSYSPGYKGFKLGSLSKSKTRYHKFNNYPNNTDVIVDYVYETKYPTKYGSRAVTDSRIVSIRIQHSLIELPESGYQSRYDDPRVGYFHTQTNDMTSIDQINYRDMIHRWEFNQKRGDTLLTERLRTLRAWQGGRFTDTSVLRCVDQIVINDDDHFETWNKISARRGWEGFMLRKNVGYEGKRSKNLVKVKKFHDAEYEVLGWDVDQHEVVRDGKSESMTMLSQVWIEHKGHLVKVGSGFTQEQRLQYMDGSIVGKTITVQYFEETANQEGGISLRFPTVKIIHGEKREL